MLTADGFEDYPIKIKVKMDEASAPDLLVTFTEQGGKPEEITSEGQEVYTEKENGKLEIKSKYSMATLKIEDKDIDLKSNDKTVSYDMKNITADKNVSIQITYKYFKAENRSFQLKKVAQEERPLKLLSAKILSGDGDGTKNNLTFNPSNEASVEIKDIRHSVVTLEMEFNQPLQERTVKECNDQRGTNYTAFDFTANMIPGLAGTFSGYITHDVDFKNNKETKLEAIKDTKYTELLIAGYGTVSYKIEIKSKNNKTETYTIEIVNPTKITGSDGKLDPSHFMKNLSVYNLESGRPAFFGITGFNGFYLPFYYKGPNFMEDGKANQSPEAYSDLMYMEDASLFLQQSGNQPFCFYYNVFADNAGSMENKHEFKRIKSLPLKPGNNGPRVGVRFVPEKLHDKYLDCFASGKDTLPNPMFWPLYGKKWKKASIKHGWLIALKNKKECTWADLTKEKLNGGFILDFLYNYRVQTKAYDEQNQSGATGKHLIIAKKPKFKYWEEDKQPDGWLPYLSGAEGDGKDIFMLRPLCESKLIKDVKYSLKCGADENSCNIESGYENVEIKFVNDDIGYPIGLKAGETYPTQEGQVPPTYTFKDGKVYKVEVTVTYVDNGGTDKLEYLFDYTDTERPIERKSIAEEVETDSHLFGVPIYYGTMQMLDPSIVKEMASTRYTANSLLFE